MAVFRPGLDRGYPESYGEAPESVPFALPPAAQFNSYRGVLVGNDSVTGYQLGCAVSLKDIGQIVGKLSRPVSIEVHFSSAPGSRQHLTPSNL